MIKTSWLKECPARRDRISLDERLNFVFREEQPSADPRYRDLPPLGKVVDAIPTNAEPGFNFGVREQFRHGLSPDRAAVSCNVRSVMVSPQEFYDSIPSSKLEMNSFPLVDPMLEDGGPLATPFNQAGELFESHVPIGSKCQETFAKFIICSVVCNHCTLNLNHNVFKVKKYLQLLFPLLTSENE